MSIEATNAVWNWSGQKSGQLLVLLRIAECTNSEGKASLAMSTLADTLRMTKRNAQRCVRALVEAGELEVDYNQGRREPNVYRIRLLDKESSNCDTHVIGDGGAAKAMSSGSTTGDVSVAQSERHAEEKPTPTVSKRDDEHFWINVCFDCFRQAIRPVPLRARRAIIIALPHLKKEHASSLLQFYRAEPLDSRKPPYISRRHSPEWLMRDLPRQLAIAVQEFPTQPLLSRELVNHR